MAWASISNYSSVLLDQFDLLPAQAMSTHNSASLHYDTFTPTSHVNFLNLSLYLMVWSYGCGGCLAYLCNLLKITQVDSISLPYTEQEFDKKATVAIITPKKDNQI